MAAGSPSFVDDGVHSPPVVLDQSGINRIKNAWVNATIRADRAGFDLIEFHFAHGYLVNQFLSPLTNFHTRLYEIGRRIRGQAVRARCFRPWHEAA